jgi:hypothetical protein
MKKTIAKLMATAMLLSAVPAVTLPSFVSKAADTEVPSVTDSTTATYTANFLGTQGQLGAAAKGEIFNFVLPTGASLDNFVFETYQAGNDEVGKFTTFTKTMDSNGLVHVKVGVDYAKMTSAQKSNFVDAVKTGKNTFKVKFTRKNINNRAGDPIDFNNADDPTKAILFSQDAFVYSSKTYYIGGIYVNGKIREVYDQDMLLAKGNVYAGISKTVNDTLAEIELLKQDNSETNKLKNNDSLRGKKLYLNTVWSGGVEYKVGKLGSQALKEAKMKKVFLKNCSKVGKGALRKCKQLRTVNLKDKNKVRKIHAKAFYDCKNLKNIIIDARKLNTIGSDSFTKLKKNCRIKLKCSKSKYNSVVKKIKKYNKKANSLKFARIAP